MKLNFNPTVPVVNENMPESCNGCYAVIKPGDVGYNLREQNFEAFLIALSSKNSH